VEEHGPYAEFNSAVAKATADAYTGGMARFGGGPEIVAEKISKALSANRPNTRYKVTPSAKVTLAMRRLLTDRMWDRMMRSQFPQPKPEG
jgi:short-subunit dehydrogenase